MNRESLHRWIDACSEQYVDALGSLADEQVEAVRLTFAPFLAPAVQKAKPGRKPRARRSATPEELSALQRQGSAACRTETADAGSTALAVVTPEGRLERVLCASPRRAYSRRQLATVCALTDAEVGVALTILRGAGKVACTGKGAGSLWVAKDPPPPSSPQQVELPAQRPESTDADDFGDERAAS